MAGEYDDLLQTLNGLTTTTRKKAVTKVLRVVGKRMQAAIKARAPYQAGEFAHGVLKPGELAADFKVRVHVATDDAAVSGDSDYVKIGPTRKTADIAVDVETGHANRIRHVPRNRPRNDETDAHPFVRPAFDATRAEGEVLFGETMADEVRKAMK